MMTQPTLTVEKNYLNWPLNRPLNQADIMHELGVHASDEKGQDLTNKVMMNLTQVDVNKAGEYPVMLSVMDNNGQSTQVSITLNIQPMRTQNATQETATPQKSRRDGYGLLSQSLLSYVYGGQLVLITGKQPTKRPLIASKVVK